MRHRGRLDRSRPGDTRPVGAHHEERSRRSGDDLGRVVRSGRADSLTPDRLLALQHRAGNRATTAFVQRMTVGYAQPAKKGKTVPVHETASSTAKAVKSVSGKDPLQEVGSATDTAGTAWKLVKLLAAGTPRQGWLPATSYQGKDEVPDDSVGYVKANKTLRSEPSDKPSMEAKFTGVKGLVSKVPGIGKTLQPSTALGKVTTGTVVAITPGLSRNGYVHVRVLEGPDISRLGWLRAKEVDTPWITKVEKDSVFDKKDRHIIGESKANKVGSREESAKVLVAGTSERARKLVEIFDAGLPALAAFERAAFVLAGPVDGLEGEFRKLSGRDLRTVIDRTFTEKPGKLAGPYLLSMLDHGGRPSPSLLIRVPMGEVDGSGAGGAWLAAGIKAAGVFVGAGRAGSKVADEVGKMAKDKRRVVELIKGMSKEDRHALLNDREAMAFIAEKVDDRERVKRWMEGRQEVERHESALKEAEETPDLSGLSVVSRAKDLAEARDRFLAALVDNAITKKRPTEKLYKLAGKGKAPSIKTSFDLPGFYEDLLDWKKDASSEDHTQIAKPDSAFRHEWAKVPISLLGITVNEKHAIETFILDPTATGRNLLVMSAKRAIMNQQASGGRKESDGSRGLGTRIGTAITESRWQSIEDEIDKLDADQRDALLKTFDPDPSNPSPDNAMAEFRNALMRAGLNKQERAGIEAMMNTRYGEAGSNYVALWQLVRAGKKADMGRVLGYLAPTKLSKLGDAMGGKSIGDAAFKIVAELEDEEFAQVRQDKVLLKELQACSKDTTWERILKLLGMAETDDQVSEDGKDKRVVIDKARRGALHNPDRWVTLLDKAIKIEEETATAKEKVSAGAEKSALYVLVSDIQTTAREVGRQRAKEDPGADPTVEAQAFMRMILAGLDPRQVDYLTRIEATKGHPLYSALAENRPIPVQNWFRQARHEGFGLIEGKKVTDRQKLVQSFESVSGRQLLDDWSNIADFRELSRQLGEWERQAEVAHGTAQRLDPIQSAEIADVIERRNAAMTEMILLKERMNAFVLGINEDRRADLCAHVRSKEDRIKIEAMVSARLIKAMKDDPDVSEALGEVTLPTDEFMHMKMRAVDALEMQRFLNTTRQWHAFSTASSQLEEATRIVKTEISSTEAKQTKAHNEGLNADEIAEIRKKGAKSSEEALDQRMLLEARFKDTQAKFKAIANVFFSLLVQGIVTALSLGLATPLSIAIQIAIGVGAEMLRTAYRYFVLGETDVEELAVGYVMGVLASSVQSLTGHLSIALQASVLHSAPLPEWLGAGIAKGLAGSAKQLVLFAPEHFVERGMQEKAIEKVIKEGESDIGDAALDMGKKVAKGFGKKLVMGAVKEGRLVVDQTMTGKPPKPTRVRKDFGTAFTDSVQGGSAQVRIVDAQGNIVAQGEQGVAEWKVRNAGLGMPSGYREDNVTGSSGLSAEQEKAWSKEERRYKQATKGSAQTAAKTLKDNRYEEQARKQLDKKRTKELKGKVKETPKAKGILELIERAKRPKASVGPLTTVDDLVGKEWRSGSTLTWSDLATFTPDERKKVEEELDLKVGDFDVALARQGLA